MYAAYIEIYVSLGIKKKKRKKERNVPD